MAVKENGEYYEILENNAKGFFRIAENHNNLKQYPVFIQVKNGTIFKVDELFRKEINNDLKSTIRFFKPVGVYSEDEFVNEILNCNDNFKSSFFKTIDLSTVYELWEKNYSAMIITDGKKQ